MKWEIRYFITESAYRAEISAYTDTFTGNRESAIRWSEQRIAHSNFVRFELIQL